MLSCESSDLQFHLCTLVLSLIAIVGDITPLDGVSKAEKNQREQEALDHMCKVLGGGSTGTFFHSVHGFVNEIITKTHISCFLIELSS